MCNKSKVLEAEFEIGTIEILHYQNLNCIHKLKFHDRTGNLRPILLNSTAVSTSKILTKITLPTNVKLIGIKAAVHNEDIKALGFVFWQPGGGETNKVIID